MKTARIARILMLTTVCVGLAACGGGSSKSSDDLTGFGPDMRPSARQTTIWEVFGKRTNPNQTVAVNKYLWNASLDVLNFLPIQSVDPFTGVIVTGYGTPPGGGRSYRATIRISDPAMDARSLKLALQGPGGGAVDSGTVRAVEDAIMTRARQLRVRDGNL